VWGRFAPLAASTTVKSIVIARWHRAYPPGSGTHRGTLAVGRGALFAMNTGVGTAVGRQLKGGHGRAWGLLVAASGILATSPSQSCAALIGRGLSWATTPAKDRTLCWLGVRRRRYGIRASEQCLSNSASRLGFEAARRHGRWGASVGSAGPPPTSVYFGEGAHPRSSYRRVRAPLWPRT
jgi:hypothetical protein